jgi:hypothetical protein
VGHCLDNSKKNYLFRGKQQLIIEGKRDKSFENDRKGKPKRKMKHQEKVCSDEQKRMSHCQERERRGLLGEQRMVDWKYENRKIPAEF